MFNMCLKRIIAAVTVCVLLLVLTGCRGKQKPENTQSENNTSDTVSVFGESQNSQGDESSQNTGTSLENKPDGSKVSKPKEDFSKEVEVTVEPNDSLRVDNTDSVLYTPESSSSAENQDNTDSVGNLWDSDGDGYYDIKIH